MRNCIFKENTGLVLFAIQNLVKCDYRNLMLWSKFIDSFRFDMKLLAALYL